MKPLNKRSEKTLRKLIEGMSLHDSKTIDNTNKTFMPVHVEIIERHHQSVVVSVAHYYEQNGDLCQDPEMEFLVSDAGCFAMTFQQAIPPRYQQAVKITEKGIQFAPRLQKELTTFANHWFSNIQSQQFGE